MEERHRLVFEINGDGRLALTEYLDRVVFCRKRVVNRVLFPRFMCGQSRPYPAMIELIARIKARHELKVVVNSDEGRKRSAFRI